MNDDSLEAVLADTFLPRHLLCARSRWPEGRPPLPREVPHLTTAIETFDTFVEITRTCTVCGVSETQTITDMDAWRALRESFARQ